MTRVVLVDPYSEIIVHSIPITRKDDLKKIEALMQQQKAETGHTPDRWIIQGGDSWKLNPGEEIVIPAEPVARTART